MLTRNHNYIDRIAIATASWVASGYRVRDVLAPQHEGGVTRKPVTLPDRCRPCHETGPEGGPRGRVPRAPGSPNARVPGASARRGGRGRVRGYGRAVRAAAARSSARPRFARVRAAPVR